jgi:hypothetical protein
MGRRVRRILPRCQRCSLERLPDETFYGGLCPACHDVYAKRRRKATPREGPESRLVLLLAQVRGMRLRDEGCLRLDR